MLSLADSFRFFLFSPKKLGDCLRFCHLLDALNYWNFLVSQIPLMYGFGLVTKESHIKAVASANVSAIPVRIPDLFHWVRR